MQWHDTQQTNLSACIRDYLDQCPREMAFPWGDDIEIPTLVEVALLDAIEKCGSLRESDISTVRVQLTLHEAYDLAIFGVRMAIHAVRTDRPQTLLSGMVGFVIDDDKLDWRDVLSALSIINDCALRLGTDLGQAIQNVDALATPLRRSVIINGFLARQPEMREVDVMGFKAVGTGKQLRYVRTL